MLWDRTTSFGGDTGYKVSISYITGKYLGLPLITVRLTHPDCLPLVEKVWEESKGKKGYNFLTLGKCNSYSLVVYWIHATIETGI